MLPAPPDPIQPVRHAVVAACLPLLLAACGPQDVVFDTGEPPPDMVCRSALDASPLELHEDWCVAFRVPVDPTTSAVALSPDGHVVAAEALADQPGRFEVASYSLEPPTGLGERRVLYEVGLYEPDGVLTSIAARDGSTAALTWGQELILGSTGEKEPQVFPMSEPLGVRFWSRDRVVFAASGWGVLGGPGLFWGGLDERLVVMDSGLAVTLPSSTHEIAADAVADLVVIGDTQTAWVIGGDVLADAMGEGNVPVARGQLLCEPDTRTCSDLRATRWGVVVAWRGEGSSRVEEITVTQVDPLVEPVSVGAPEVLLAAGAAPSTLRVDLEGTAGVLALWLRDPSEDRFELVGVVPRGEP